MEDRGFEPLTFWLPAGEFVSPKNLKFPRENAILPPLDGISSDFI